jgi:hypothetical protein
MAATTAARRARFRSAVGRLGDPEEAEQAVRCRPSYGAGVNPPVRSC